MSEQGGGGFCSVLLVGFLLSGHPLFHGGTKYSHIYILPTTGQVAPDDVAGLSNHFWGYLSNMVF